MKNSTHTLTDQEKRLENAKLTKERNKELEECLSVTPLPLSREIIPPKPYPFEALGSLLGSFAKRIHEIVKAPDSVCGHSVLAAASLITQPHGDIHIDGRKHPLSIFALTAAESGGRKSAVDKIVLQPVRDYERMLADSYKEEMRTHKNAIDIWKKQRETLLKSNKITESILKEMSPEPERPLEPYVLLDEPTYEGLIKLFAVGQPSLGIFSDEGALMLGGFSMGKENMQKTACGLSSLWDGKPASRIRGGDQNLLLYGRRLSMHLMIQENFLTSFLNNPLLIGQGLVGRCLIVAPLPCGNRPYDETDIYQESITKKYNNIVSSIFAEPFPLNNKDIGNELSPRAVRLSIEAKRLWIHFHDEMQVSLTKNGVYATIRRSANKAAEHALRIAGALALFENIYLTEVALDIMERAIVLTRYYLDELLRITDIETNNPDMELAQATLDWMKNKELEGVYEVFKLQTIYQSAGPSGVRNKERALTIMRILEGHDQIKMVSGQKMTWRLV